MGKPRKGDTVIAASMTERWTVTFTSMEAVCVRNRRGRRRWIDLQSLECVDPDDGIWQELQADNG